MLIAEKAFSNERLRMRFIGKLQRMCVCEKRTSNGLCARCWPDQTSDMAAPSACLAVFEPQRVCQLLGVQHLISTLLRTQQHGALSRRPSG